MMWQKKWIKKFNEEINIFLTNIFSANINNSVHVNSTGKIELENFALWHAKVGAIICKNVFRFSQDMVQAVENHTLGKRKMDLLSKILFVADATGLDRNWDDLEYARKLSEVSLDDTIIYIIDINIKDNIAKKRQIHPESIMLRNELLSEKNLL